MSGRNLFSLPNLATFGNLAAGFSALILASQGDLIRAALLVAVAAVFDLLDGIIARQADAESEFGANLDSLADMVSFGAAPALTLYIASLSESGSFGVALAALFVVAGAARLARFPLVKDSSRRVFVGLPIPPAGVALSALAATQPQPAVACATVLALGVLMVSVFPFPTLRSFAERREEDREERPE